MKKNFTAPSLKVDLFNKEIILQASMVAPTNSEFAKFRLQSKMDNSERTSFGIFDIFLN